MSDREFVVKYQDNQLRSVGLLNIDGKSHEDVSKKFWKLMGGRRDRYVLFEIIER